MDWLLYTSDLHNERVEDKLMQIRKTYDEG